MEHVKKAVTSVETAPKQKHVRSCIVFAWDCQTSLPIWSALRMQPVLSDQVVAYKSLITIHKILSNGPHVVLSEALGQDTYFENCLRVHGRTNLGHGYGPLIEGYICFLRRKIAFHNKHPSFTGNFDYEEFETVNGLGDLDDCYERISNLLDLEDDLDTFQKIIFHSVRPTAQSECRIASLVPLVEESWGIYKFMTSMLTAMHHQVSEPEPLLPLVERFLSLFSSLKTFYTHCSSLQYLTSLISIPCLPADPPFFEVGETKVVSRELKPNHPPPPPPPPRDQDVEVDLLGLGEDGGEHSSSMTTTTTTTTTESLIPDPSLLKALQVSQTECQQLQAQLSLQQREQRSLLTKLSQAQSHIAFLTKQMEDMDGTDELLERYETLESLYNSLRSEHLELLERANLLKTDTEQKMLSLSLSSSSSESSPIAQELLEAIRLIERATTSLVEVHQSSEQRIVVDATIKISGVVGSLIKYAIEVQDEIVVAASAGGDGGDDGGVESFYLKNSKWTNGLISAAQAVAKTTVQLLGCADSYLSDNAGDGEGDGDSSMLIASSSQVTAATLQLVTASRVKAPATSVSLKKLEGAAKAISECNKNLVSILLGEGGTLQRGGGGDFSIPEDSFSLKVEELERQARVLALEKELGEARDDLCLLRRKAYE